MKEGLSQSHQPEEEPVLHLRCRMPWGFFKPLLPSTEKAGPEAHGAPDPLALESSPPGGRSPWGTIPSGERAILGEIL
jgi:hypothetical protein